MCLTPLIPTCPHKNVWIHVVVVVVVVDVVAVVVVVVVVVDAERWGFEERLEKIGSDDWKRKVEAKKRRTDSRRFRAASPCR